MKTEAAERMRQKLEKRLLPKLKVSLPQMAEKLRFPHMGQRESFAMLLFFICTLFIIIMGFLMIIAEIPIIRAAAIQRCSSGEPPLDPPKS